MRAIRSSNTPVRAFPNRPLLTLEGGADDFLIKNRAAWTPHQGTTLRSGHYSWCAPPDHWYLMVGWLNHPITIVKYGRP